MHSGARVNHSGKLSIRRAELADAQIIVPFAARIYYETFVAVNSPENMQAYLSAAFTLPQFEAELSDTRSIFYLAEIDEQLAGYAKLFAGESPDCVTGSKPVELVRFYVDQRWHGSGLASALMETCLNEARNQGFSTMYLGVWEHNLRAQAFYRKWNFVRVGEHVFHMGNDAQVDWWMSRSLEE